MKKAIVTKQAPKPIGPYSQAIQAGDFLFVSGQIPTDPKTGKLVTHSIEAASEQVFDNIESILKEAFLDWKDVVKVEMFFVNLKRDFDAVNSLYSKRVAEAHFSPARQAVEVAGLPKGALLEVSCIAFINSNDTVDA